MAGNKDLIRHIETSAFGEQKVVAPFQVANATFAYGVVSTVVASGLFGSGEITAGSGLAAVHSGAATNSSGILQTRRVLQYVPGQGGLFRGTAMFTDGVDGSQQLFGIGDDLDGFFFGYNGAEFGILKRRDGIDEWVAQADWNVDPGDGTTRLPLIDWTKGNVFQIQYQWLGFGLIKFGMEEPSTGRLIPCHDWEYANANIYPSILNPSLPCMVRSENTTNDTDIVVKTACMAAFTEGELPTVGPGRGISNDKASVGAIETNIVTIRNKSTFKGIRNRSHVRLLVMSAAVEGNKPVSIRLVFNSTLGGSPSYTSISEDSLIEYDVAGTTLTGGTEVMTIGLAKSDNFFIQSSEKLLITLAPGAWVTISAESSTGGSADVLASFTWREDF